MRIINSYIDLMRQLNLSLEICSLLLDSPSEIINVLKTIPKDGK